MKYTGLPPGYYGIDKIKGISRRLFCCRLALFLMIPAYLYSIISVILILHSNTELEGFIIKSDLWVNALLFGISVILLFVGLKIFASAVGSVLRGEDILKPIVEVSGRYVCRQVSVISMMIASMLTMLIIQNGYSTDLIYILISTMIVGNVVYIAVGSKARKLYVLRDKTLDNLKDNSTNGGTLSI
jgi:hypothetical protein